MPKFSQLIYEEEVEKKSLAQLCEAMSGEQIAKELNVTRQYVSQTLKSGLRKYYAAVKSVTKESPFKIAVTLMEMLRVEDDDVANFLSLFPPDLRKDIEADAKNFMKRRR